MDTERKNVAWGEGRIAFLAHKEEIEARLNEGWPAAKVYSELKDKLNGLGYQGFTRNIRSIIRGEAAKAKASKPITPTPVAAQEPVTRQSNQLNMPTAPSFFKKPDAIPDQSKLI